MTTLNAKEAAPVGVVGAGMSVRTVVDSQVPTPIVRMLEWLRGEGATAREAGEVAPAGCTTLWQPGRWQKEFAAGVGEVGEVGEGEVVVGVRQPLIP